MPPPFGSGYPAVVGVSAWAAVSFNCAAPFRERLRAGRVPQRPVPARFNCAAPFRERLPGGVLTGIFTSSGALQLCRPLSGAVTRQLLRVRWPRASLQLCRPLSGAVTSKCGGGAGVGGSASIVPPPFGSGYRDLALLSRLQSQPLQLCRPLSGAVTALGLAFALYQVVASIVPPPFGSGYDLLLLLPAPLLEMASIVPPPFGSGYWSWCAGSGCGGCRLQLCRPLSGAVT